MKLRVAIVTESFLPQLNGVTNSVVRVLDTLHEQGHEAIVIAPSNGIADLQLERQYRGFNIVRVPSLPFRQFPVAMPNPFLANILNKFKPDVLHAASPFILGGTAIGVAKRMGIPSVAVYQTDLAGYAARYGLSFARSVADKFMTNIHGLADVNLAPTSESVEYLTGLGIKNVSVWGRGVDISRFHPNLKLDAETLALRTRLLAGRTRLIGYVGRLAPEKQVERFAELADLSDCAIVIIGEGAERARLEKLLPHPHVTFLGALTGDELARAYASLDLFVHFGAEETYGQTIQEALASGVPVVVPDAGGPRHIVSHGKTGFLVDPNEKYIARRAASFLLREDSVRARMGEAGRRAMLDRTWEANNKRLIGFYESAIERVVMTPQSVNELV